jgi:hypothetical protein
LRTGPLVRRGANVSRAGQAVPTLPRILPRVFGRQHTSLTPFPLPSIASKSEVHSSCRLPINLRSFLAEQLGCQSNTNDEAILAFAASADQSKLNKLARAIRRYSTARAHEAWAECSVPVTRFIDALQRNRLMVLCLRCVRVDFDRPAACEHQCNGCLPITLTRTDTLNLSGDGQTVAEQVQRLVEEFRALRTAFGLPHFDLDCYVRGDHLTLMWRPLP